MLGRKENIRTRAISPPKLQVIFLRLMSASDMTWEGLHGIRNLSELISL